MTESDIVARAWEIVTKVRAGQLDPRPGAQALGLPYDQDIIMAIMERAAGLAARTVDDGVLERVKVLADGLSRAHAVDLRALLAAVGVK